MCTIDSMNEQTFGDVLHAATDAQNDSIKSENEKSQQDNRWNSLSKDIPANRRNVADQREPSALTNVPEVPTAVQELQSHLQTTEQSADRHENHQGLAEIRWQWGQDVPSPAAAELSSDQAKAKQLEKTSQEKGQSLQERADVYLNDPNTPYLREIINGAFGWNAQSGMRFDASKKPEELCALVVMLHDSGYGKTRMTGDQQFSKALQDGVSAMRKDVRTGESGWAFAGMSGYLPDINVADRLLSQKQQKNEKVTQDEFDAYVISALSCGDSATALKLIQMAGKFLPDQSNAMDSALNRLAGEHAHIKNTFQIAQEIYSPDRQQEMDLAYSSIGSGVLKDLAESPIAKRLQKTAEKQVRAAVTAERNTSYNKQQVVDVPTQIFKAESVYGVNIETALMSGKSVEDLLEQQAKREKDVVTARIANSIAAELIRRLHPEMTVPARLQMRQEKVQRGGFDPRQFTGFPAINFDYQEVYDRGFMENDIDQSARQNRLYGITPNNVDFTKSVVQAQNKQLDTTTFKALVALIRYPGAFTYTYNEKLNRDLVDRNKSGTHRGQYQEGKQAFANAMMGGLEFLQTVVEQPQLQDVLVSQFGFDRQILDNLKDDSENGPLQALLQAFGETSLAAKATMPDEDKPLTIGEIAMVDPDQIAQDADLAEKLAKAGQAELTTLKTQATEKTKQKVAELLADAQTKQQELVEKQVKLQTPLEELARARRMMDIAGNELNQLDFVKIVGDFSPTRLINLSGQRVMTAAEHTLAVDQARRKVDDAKNAAIKAQEVVNDIGEVLPSDLEALQDRVVKLANLNTQLP